MDRQTRLVLRNLRDARRSAKLSGRIRLSRAYLLAVRRLLALPCNRTGADKTWVADVIDAHDRHYAAVRRA